MSLIDGTDLIEAGWQPGPEISQALEKAAEYEARGISDKKYLLKLLARDIPKSEPKLVAREEPAPLGEAIEATCELDEQNIAKVRKTMSELLRMPRIARGAIMPDACPVGGGPATIPVGGAIAVENAIIPAAHSSDICCSMYATFFDAGESEVGELLDHLMGSTRFGHGGRKPEDHVHHPVLDEDVWENKFLQGLERHARMHMADQGDGNHFAFLGRVRLDGTALAELERGGHGAMAGALRAHGEPFESHVLVTHHGSRGLGAQVYKRGQNAAEKHTKKIAQGIPKAAAWLDYDTGVGGSYWEALQYVGRWTKANHQSIHARFLERSQGRKVVEFGNEHNFVWRRGNHFLHGKGATPAWNDAAGNPLLGLIPLNMASPILMVLGRDNEDYLSFCPHGAGRNVSRTATLKPFRQKNGELDGERVAEAIAESTDGIDVRWFHGKADLSESPIGYKSAEQVKAQIQQFGLADIVAEIEPLGSIMAGDSGPAPWMRRKDVLSPKQIRQIGHPRRTPQDAPEARTPGGLGGLGRLLCRPHKRLHAEVELVARFLRDALEGLEFLHPQQGRVVGELLGDRRLRLERRLERLVFSGGLDLDRLRLLLRFDQHRFALALGLEHAIHDLAQIAREHQILDICPCDLDTIRGRRFAHVGADVVRDLVAVFEDLVERLVGEEPARAELDVLVDPVLVRTHLVERGFDIGDAEIDQHADPDRDLVGGQDLLSFERQRLVADIDHHHMALHLVLLALLRPRPGRSVRFLPLVVAGFKRFDEDAILVEGTEVGLVYSDLGQHLIPQKCWEGQYSSDVKDACRGQILI